MSVCGRIRWRCRACADSWCETGVGQAPEEVRQALLARRGAARLCLATKDTTLVQVLRALREIRGLSLVEARLAAAELSGAGLVGTYVEMAHLAEGLRRRSIATAVAQ
ncbi:hypothetical protein FNH09_21895 [Streptomyces adustus]|uniref:Uncharacterized protein n=1 Tax=Streptomyces adustus TaxID=1609272 RepID=A0A5N8VGL3_9ACTN|nr:hypothetical protein [Streptomyces adustus]